MRPEAEGDSGEMRQCPNRARRRTWFVSGERPPFCPRHHHAGISYVRTRRLGAAPYAGAPGVAPLSLATSKAPVWATVTFPVPRAARLRPLGRWPPGWPGPSPPSRTFPPRCPRGPPSSQPPASSPSCHSVCGAAWSPPSSPVTPEGGGLVGPLRIPGLGGAPGHRRCLRWPGRGLTGACLRPRCCLSVRAAWSKGPLPSPRSTM